MRAAHVLRCRTAPYALRRGMGDDRHVKIATFNVNGIKTRLPNLLQWLEREQPDVA